MVMLDVRRVHSPDQDQRSRHDITRIRGAERELPAFCLPSLLPAQPSACQALAHDDRLTNMPFRSGALKADLPHSLPDLPGNVIVRIFPA